MAGEDAATPPLSLISFRTVSADREQSQNLPGKESREFRPGVVEVGGSVLGCGSPMECLSVRRVQAFSVERPLGLRMMDPVFFLLIRWDKHLGIQRGGLNKK